MMAASSNRRGEPVEIVMLLKQSLARAISRLSDNQWRGRHFDMRFGCDDELYNRQRVVIIVDTRRRIFTSMRSPNFPRCPSGRALHNGLFDGRIWPKAGCASIAYAAMAPIDFLPLTAAPSFLAKQQSRSRAILR
jgi:hypothetical protein